MLHLQLNHQACINNNFLETSQRNKTSLHQHQNRISQQSSKLKQISLQLAMSSYNSCHHQYTISKISNRHNKDNNKDRPLIRALKSKTPKVINEVASKLSSSNSPRQSKATIPAYRLPIHTDKEGGQPNDH